MTDTKKPEVKKPEVKKPEVKKSEVKKLYICTYPGQVRMPDGRIKYFGRNDVQAFPDKFEVPDIFEPVSDITVDFDQSSEAELLHGNFDVQDLRNYLHKTYGRTISSTDKAILIAELIDARYRATDAKYQPVK